MSLAMADTLMPPAKTSQQHIDGLYALFGTSSQSALLWEGLDKETRTCFCKFAGLTVQHINLPLQQYNELDRHKLLKAIKSLAKIANQFHKVSLSEFK